MKCLRDGDFRVLELVGVSFDWVASKHSCGLTRPNGIPRKHLEKKVKSQ